MRKLSLVFIIKANFLRLKMSRAKLEQAIYYIGDNTELATAGKLRENVVKHAGKNVNQIPLVEFNPKVPKEMPSELILLAHSDDSRQHIGDKTPKELIQELAKQFQGKDKTQLKSLILVSCEGGFGEHPLALEVAKELHKQGFTQAIVKAATHPQGSKVGGVVSVTTHAGISILQGNEDGKVSAVMYGNQKTADYIRWKELDRMRGRAKKPRQGWTESLEREMDNLADKHSSFRGFDERHPDYCVIKLVSDIEDLDAPYNCYTKEGAQAQLSLDVAIALDSLRVKRNAYRRLEDSKTVAFIDRVIQKIYENPSMTKNEILQILANKDIVKNAKREIVSDIRETLTQQIDTKRMAMDPSARPSKANTIASKIEADEDYLARIIQKDGIFDKIWRSIFGADEFTQGVRLLLKRVNAQTLLAKADREDIIGHIESQKEKDVKKLTVTSGIDIGFINTKKTVKTPLNNLYDALKIYYDKPNPTVSDWQLVEAAKLEYNKNQPNGYKSQELEHLIKQLDANNQKFNDIGTGLKEIKGQVNAAIQSYLNTHDKGFDTDELHRPKVAVMKVMQAYVSEPTEKNWNALEKATADNPGWDKGWFSKVRFLMSEVQLARKEQEDETARLSSGYRV